ncbi:MAG: hemolysin III [Flavobacterium sp. MedPE-SWcel]|uniref:PAQR family membrane homeostasis protein TrhA n=1 Tax=uncultured Flavobacterium sp. TaxID=165435 RepID=UPI0009115E50|nr:hemolysin III family protein [uncultured Flavobacterium sp.]OIQ22465.1 MAG: hemolysin III [Flavobacterium sp. MedPE-SWcel]
MPKKNRKQEEFWNVITHGLGALLSIIGLILLALFSIRNGSTIHIVTSLVFGISLVILYTASTIYHAVVKLKWKRFFRLIDHLSIYVLIAGTYTPFALLGLKGTWGWVIFGLIWAFAIIGFIFKFSPLRRSEKLSLSLYAIMGWLIIIAIKPLLANVAPQALWYLLGGGLCYTFGIYFYAKEKISYNHAIWHVFVLGGSTLHFLGVFLYLIP